MTSFMTTNRSLCLIQTSQMSLIQDVTRANRHELVTRLLDLQRQNARLRTERLREQLLARLHDRLRRVANSDRQTRQRLKTVIDAFNTCDKHSLRVRLARVDDHLERSRDQQTQCVATSVDNACCELSTIGWESESQSEATASQSDSERRAFACNTCPKLYRHRRSLLRHLNTCTRRKKTNGVVKTSGETAALVCQRPDCGLTFQNRTLFSRHFSMHAQKPRTCFKCGLKCEHSRQLKQHVLTHAQPQCARPELRCQWISCDFTCGDEQLLARHVAKHDCAERPFACHDSNCSYKTSDPLNLETHAKSAHEKVFVVL